MANLTVNTAQNQALPVVFCYPESDQYPIDDVCRKIVLALEKLNWSFPDFKVTFSELKTSKHVFRRVHTIEGINFRIYFCRIQGFQGMLDGVWNNCSAVNSIAIPKKNLRVNEDESGPSLQVYVGSDWEKDCEEFLKGHQIHAKESQKPRTYLCYKGSQSQNEIHNFRGRRQPYLVSYNDLQREYSPEKEDPLHYKTQEIFDEFIAYLTEKVLKPLEEAKAKIDHAKSTL